MFCFFPICPTAIMNFDKLNKVGRMESAFLPTRKLVDVEKETNLCITAVRKVVTKFGSSITVDVNNTYSTFLPSRIAKMLTADEDDTMMKMKSAIDEKRLYMRYLGGLNNNVEFLYI